MKRSRGAIRWSYLFSSQTRAAARPSPGRAERCACFSHPRGRSDRGRRFLRHGFLCGHLEGKDLQASARMAAAVRDPQRSGLRPDGRKNQLSVSGGDFGLEIRREHARGSFAKFSRCRRNDRRQGYTQSAACTPWLSKPPCPRPRVRGGGLDEKRLEDYSVTIVAGAGRPS